MKARVMGWIANGAFVSAVFVEALRVRSMDDGAHAAAVLLFMFAGRARVVAWYRGIAEEFGR